MLHNNDSVRDKLIEITNQGLMLKSIALNIGVDVNDLSRFKGGMECLKQSDVEILSEYLYEVHIPQWKSVSKEKLMTARERLLASKNKSGMTMRERILESINKQNEEKPKRKRSQVTLDLLRELDS